MVALICASVEKCVGQSLHSIKELAYLELAELMQNCLHHSQWLVIFCTSTPDLIHSQPHEVVMNTHQEHVQIQLLRSQDM